ncbi:6,7-dimethyl-8-ribityllumazine synthase [Halococcus qingdaonensis]|uniref:6,7-dimethyl-8-ribityllumazine synthase n=1 Tax=Halococcus qingdaonensis TaxID=224402 RepID=UPI0021165707|nr:6,7-dimethyl-8-ribityllumazine synthase [Halococcus qingdaonensis]
MPSLGLVVAQFYGELAAEMEQHARDAAAEHGAEIAETIPVPGAYDTPLAADRLARRDGIDAVAALGAIVSGDTDHDQVIAGAAAQGLTDVSLDRDKPVAFGVLGPGMSGAEARERVDYGARAVESALDQLEALA